MGSAGHELGPYCVTGGEFSPMFIHVSPMNRAASPANDLGYHTLVGRSNPMQWPTTPELAELQTDLTHHTDSRYCHCHNKQYKSKTNQLHLTHRSSDTLRRLSTKTASSSKKLHSRTPLITTSHKIGLDSKSTTSYSESLVEGSTGKVP